MFYRIIGIVSLVLGGIAGLIAAGEWGAIVGGLTGALLGLVIVGYARKRSPTVGGKSHHRGPATLIVLLLFACGGDQGLSFSCTDGPPSRTTTMQDTHCGQKSASDGMVVGEICGPAIDPPMNR